MDHIKEKTAFITGGARGIGLGIARAFAQEGAKLALVDIDEAALNAARAELGKLTSVETFLLDVRDREAYARVADEAEARLGRVSILLQQRGCGCWRRRCPPDLRAVGLGHGCQLERGDQWHPDLCAADDRTLAGGGPCADLRNEDRA